MLFLEFLPRLHHFKRESSIWAWKRRPFPKAIFSLTVGEQESIFLVNYSYLFLVNQQPAPWPSGVADEKEFPEGAHTKTRGNFYSEGGLTLMNEPTINCPNCKVEIMPIDSLAAPKADSEGVS